MNRHSFDVRVMIRVAVLSAISFALMFLEFPLLVDFLKYDPSDVAALFGAFALGPGAGVLIELIKNGLFLLTRGNVIGVAANFVTGASLVFPAAVVYHRLRTRTGALIALLVGSVSMVVVMAAANYLVFLPLYGIPMAQAEGLILTVITPFNVIKAIITATITFVLYKPLRKTILLGIDRGN